MCRPSRHPTRFVHLGLAVALSLLVLAALLPGRLPRVVGQTVSVTPPINDNFANATVITSLPFNDVVSPTATTEFGEPQACNFMTQTVWYALTLPQTTVVSADTVGSVGQGAISIYLGNGQGINSLSLQACTLGGSPAVFTAHAGLTYYVQGGIGFGPPGNLHVNLRAVPPPANDDFANATSISALPFGSTVDGAAATVEPGEPTPSCGFGQITNSVWYSFTPLSDESVTLSTAPGNQQVDAYSGTSLTSLTDLGCRSFGGSLTLKVSAGQTYHFQLAGLFGNTSLGLNVVITPPPQANFGFNPSDPSIFDQVQFSDFSSDPGQVGIQSQAWSFGDGATATGCCPTHRFAKDGDYTVKETVTTTDGRSGSATRTVHVSTHDVTIVKLEVPQSAKPGQTRPITVNISNGHYPETVQVQILKGGPNGFQPVGTLTQSVPVTQGNHTTQFSFNYTFTSDDAAAGKVTFEAIATISGARDALPADNTVIALPTTVH
jgi:hypothetical protein